VAAFQASGWSGTFVAINDNIAGFNPTTDSVVFLQNYNIIVASHPIQVV
jgi:hypothetical protein